MKPMQTIRSIADALDRARDGVASGNWAYVRDQMKRIAEWAKGMEVAADTSDLVKEHDAKGKDAKK